MAERLQKWIAARGVASRRAVETMIREGRVQVNGTPASLGMCVGPGDEVRIDGRPVQERPPMRYLMLHKPRGYVTTLSDERGRPTVAQLVAGCGERVYPVGRLDYDSEGLLLLTNDGALTQRLTHPAHEVDKVYELRVKDYTDAGLARLREPMTLDGHRLRPAQVQLLEVTDGRARLRMTIHEGRNRQVRRMCQQAGMTVLRLRRVAEGPLQLGALPPGKWRELTAAERRALGLR